MTEHHDIVSEGLKAAPTITVGSLTLLGVGLSDWVLILTVFYTILQLYFLLRDKWWRQRKGNHVCE
jgi:hypothetical protein